MATLKVVNTENKETGTVQVDDSVVSAKFRPGLLHQYVRMQLRARRQGTHSTLTRAEVSGSGAKPFRQKGTGQARQGTLIGPHQPGGGIAFGPKPRCYEVSMNKKAKLEALRGALSQKTYEKKLSVTEDFDIKSGKTKEAAKAVKAWGAKSVLLIGTFSDATIKSFQNLDNAKLLKPEGVNVYDVLNHDLVLLAKNSLDALKTRLATSSRKAVA